MTEPFDDLLADPGTRERAAKLLRLLASDAAGEAEAARAALLRLLTRHGATFDDLAHGLLDAAPPSGLTLGEASALQAVLAATERRATLAEAAVRTASAETKRLRAVAARWRAMGIAGAGAGALLVAVAVLPGMVHQVPRAVASKALEPRPATVPAPALPPSSAEPAEHAPTPQSSSPVAWRGRVLPSEGVFLQLNPVPSSPSTAFLPQGTEVSVDEVFPMLDMTWMKVRTPQGAGFVPASAIAPE